MTLSQDIPIEMSWLSTEDLLRKVKRNSNSDISKVFHGVYPIDKLPKFVSHRPYLIIVNTHTHNLEGEHWICVFINDNREGEVFDSLANVPNAILSQWLNRFTCRWKRNECIYQSPLSATCGAYVLYYCLNRLNFDTLQDFLQTFTKKPLVNDILVLDFYDRLK